MRFTSVRRPGAIVASVLLVVLATAATTVSTARAQSAHPAAGAQGTLSPAQARALSTNVTDKVVVVFKNQVASLPDTPANSTVRASMVRSLQQGVMSELTATHARDIHSISLVNAVSATVSPGMAKVLAANPAVAKVVRDLPIPIATKTALPKAARGFKPLAGACAPKGKVQLDPQAIESIDAASATAGAPSAQALHYTGAGVKVAWIADGLDINNPDFIRANGQHVFVDYQDFSGTGTNSPTGGGEAFLDASSIAAQGRHVYNVASYGLGLTVPCNIRILGVAPGASLVGLNVSGGAGGAFNSTFLRAIDYAVSHDHVNVINESFGSNPFPDEANLDLTVQANDMAIKAGAVVSVSSGDSGPTNTIGSPASDPKVISVGATTTYRAYAQAGVGGITAAGVKGWLNNNISGISSGGFDQTGGTVDVVAPGDLNWALCTPNPSRFFECTDFSGKPSSVELSGGTSESAPLTSGVAALVIQAYRKAHGGVTPSPALVKQIIMSTAQYINAPAEQQGAGMVDAYQAVLAARSFNTNNRAGQAVLASPNQLNAVDQPGSIEGFTEKLTNDGANTVTLGLSSRTLSGYTPVATNSLTLTKKSDYSTEVKFTVPKGQARLNASVALVGGANLSLISPSGQLALYNLPQGPGNYANAQVANPAPGTWTALIGGIPDSDAATVPAKFQASTATWTPFGMLTSHSVTLKAGASATVLFTATTPSQAGDESGFIMVHSAATSVPGFTLVTSIPVTLRSLVPTPAPTTTVTGTLTGGNGRSFTSGQTNYYQVRIPSGLQALNVSVATHNAGNQVFAELVNPAGDVASASANGLLVTTVSGLPELKPEVGAQLHVLNPTPGLWTVVADFYGVVSGAAVSAPFTITLDDNPVTASASDLPDSASTTLPAGTPVTALVTVTNTGTTPEAYFVDPRTSGQATLKLSTQTLATVPMPDVFGFAPVYIVPSHTTTINATVSAPIPLLFDLSYPFGDPDLLSTTGKTATRSYSVPEVPAGDWSVTPSMIALTGKNPAKFVNANVSMTATTAGFDRTVTTPTGDLWLGSTNINAAFTPYVVNPGGSVTIPVTITPKGSPGTVVSGTLYLSDSSFIPGFGFIGDIGGAAAAGSDVAAFPYTYTIG